MIRSMTGFGEAEVATPAGLLRAELRTVNHRFFSVNIRNPAALDRYEPQIREWLKRLIPRGHLSITYRLENAGEDGAAGEPTLTLDLERAAEYVRIFRELQTRFELPGEVTLQMVAAQPDLVIRQQVEAPVLTADPVRDVTERAARATIAMREAEGRTLRGDLEARLAAIGSALEVVGQRAPARLARERERLRQAVAELVADARLDDERVAREIALIADRWDISEEIVRLRAHIAHFDAMLEEDAAEPVGKRLSFLIQEMHREANTMGAKANDAEIEHRVVAIKNEIERLREQVENVE